MAGAAAGTALALYLSSEGGQETLNIAKDKLLELEKEMEETIKEQMTSLTSNMDDLTTQIKATKDKVLAAAKSANGEAELAEEVKPAKKA